MDLQFSLNTYTEFIFKQQKSVILNSAAVNTLVYISLLTGLDISIKQIPRSRVAGSKVLLYFKVNAWETIFGIIKRDSSEIS